jgi:hypothetical protein
VALLGEKPKPRTAVGCDLEVRDADVAVLDGQGFIANDDGSLARLLPGKREVVGGVQPLRLVPLKH